MSKDIVVLRIIEKPGFATKLAQISIGANDLYIGTSAYVQLPTSSNANTGDKYICDAIELDVREKEVQTDKGIEVRKYNKVVSITNVRKV